MIDTTKSVSGVSYNGTSMELIGTPQGEYHVKAIDYDGTILKEAWLNTGDVFELPALPTHTGLTAQEWRCIQTITNNTVTVEDFDIVVGILYTTTSGLNEFDIELTNDTGLEVTLNMEGGTEIDWGDGTTDTNTTHTYASTGSYTISTDHTKQIVNTNVGLFGQSASAPNYYVTHVRLGEAILANPSFYKPFSACYNLTYITVPKKVTDMGEFASYCYKLKSFVLPNLQALYTNTFYFCTSLTDIVLYNNIQTIGSYSFGYCTSLKKLNLALPNVSIIGSYAVARSGIEKLKLGTISNNTNYQCNGCYALQEVIMTGGNLGTNSITNVFNQCTNLKSITLPNSVTRIGTRTFLQCYFLPEIKIPSGVTDLDSQCFASCYNLVKYDFSSATAVPTLANTNAFSEINYLAKIIVPDALYENWIVASNWATYAEHIVKASEVE